jgi:hypothetical protein
MLSHRKAIRVFLISSPAAETERTGTAWLGVPKGRSTTGWFARCCLPQLDTAALCLRTFLASIGPGSPLPAIPSCGPSGAHTAPVRAPPYPAPGIPPGPGIRPGCGRPRPRLPGTSTSGARCCCPRAPPVALPGSAYRRKYPAD